MLSETSKWRQSAKRCDIRVFSLQRRLIDCEECERLAPKRKPYTIKCFKVKWQGKGLLYQAFNRLTINPAVHYD
jgi:ribosomal protein L37AE/L43A